MKDTPSRDVKHWASVKVSGDAARTSPFGSSRIGDTGSDVDDLLSGVATV